MTFEFTKHALDVLKERNIQEELVRETIESPDWKAEGADGNIHFYKGVPECGRFLHVVLNAQKNPAKVVTAFLDRRARRPQ